MSEINNYRYDIHSEHYIINSIILNHTLCSKIINNYAHSEDVAVSLSIVDEYSVSDNITVLLE